MVKLFDAQSDELIGEITEEQFDFIQNNLEEEEVGDVDYYINLMTLDMFEAEGADSELVALLRKAMGEREDMDLRWE